MLNTGALDFSPTTPISFPSQVLNTQNTPRVVTLTNSGSVTVSISSLTVSPGFQVTNNCNGSIAAGAKCSLNIVSAPAVLGYYTGSITMHDSASSKPQVIELSGQGTLVGLLPDPVNFAAKQVGTTSPAQKLAVTNYNSAPIIIFGIKVEGADARAFTVSNVGQLHDSGTGGWSNL